MMEVLAKHSFMKVDDKTLQAYRQQGKTPTLKANKVPYGSSADFFNTDKKGINNQMSPLSHRSNGSGSRLGALGQIQDQEQEKFWSEIINEDTRKHHMETERNTMLRFRRN